ncbi:hypothetical protein ACFL1I_01730 [Candidatus Omnitrophota bacterium]
MQDNISPEERLLRLIRKPAKKTAQKNQIAQPKLTKRDPEQRFFPILLPVLALLAAYFIFDLLSARPQRPVQFTPQALSLPRQLSPEVETAKPLAYYLEPIKAKGLFADSGPTTAALAPSATFTEIVSQLKLQGIISGPEPQAVIEDTRTKKVHFLSPGGYIGEIELTEILPGKVKLNYHGQEAELAL